mgnify:CR=1 FL=1
MGIGIGRFLPWKLKWNSSHRDRNLVTKNGKKCPKSKMGIGFEHCDVGFSKTNGLRNGIGTPFRTLATIFVVFTTNKIIKHKLTSSINRI